MTTEVAVRRAQEEIFRGLRREPVGARAYLPFDPDDKLDTELWLRRQIDTAITPRYQGTDAFVAQALKWDARQEVRKARRQVHRLANGRIAPVLELDAVAGRAGRLPWQDSDWEALESLAASAATAAWNLV